MTCSRIPSHVRQYWTLWRRWRPSRWTLVGAYSGPPTAHEAAARLFGETLVLPPGEHPVEAKSRCHGRHP